MGIKANFNMDDIRKRVYAQRDKFIEASMEAFKLACIKMVDRAKQTNTYMDQTHALRSSIGCVLYHKGVEVFNYFKAEDGEGSTEGVEKGLALARKIAEEAGNKLIVAVVVAGMDYAVYVEAKGRDVLTGSTHQFADDLKDEFENVKYAFYEHLIG